LKQYLGLALLGVFGSTCLALAGEMPCSIRPKSGTNNKDLVAMAKISQADAQTAAVASLPKDTKATVKEAELEAEDGCLVYSFDIAIEGQKAVREVLVDAGDGKVLSTKDEDEAMEKAKEKAKKP
jgi:uncharacterized membrane protein YkoI